MSKRLVLTAATVLTLALPAIANAQGVPGGIDRGAREGERAAGPVGAIVGGTIGGVVGGVSSILGVDDRPRFRTYVVEQHHPSYRYSDEVRVGAVLPATGVTYYEVPAEYGPAREYRYTIVNDRPVLVDRSHRIVEVID